MIATQVSTPPVTAPPKRDEQAILAAFILACKWWAQLDKYPPDTYYKGQRVLESAWWVDMEQTVFTYESMGLALRFDHGWTDYQLRRLTEHVKEGVQ